MEQLIEECWKQFCNNFISPPIRRDQFVTMFWQVVYNNGYTENKGMMTPSDEEVVRTADPVAAIMKAI